MTLAFFFCVHCSLIFSFHAFQLSPTQPIFQLLRLVFFFAFWGLFAATILAFLPSKPALLTQLLWSFPLVSLLFDPVHSLSLAREAELCPEYPKHTSNTTRSWACAELTKTGLMQCAPLSPNKQLGEALWGGESFQRGICRFCHCHWRFFSVTVSHVQTLSYTE